MAVASPLERELRRMEIIARREMRRAVGRSLPGMAERRRIALTTRDGEADRRER